jgi:hypothetical protein
VAGTKFHAASAGAVVAFEADNYVADGSSGWRVLLQAVARVVTDPDQLDQVEWLGVDPAAIDGGPDR